MNKTIEDLKDAIEIHDLGFLYVDEKWGYIQKYVKIDPEQLAIYLHGIGYRKIDGKKKT